jgi:hypothetical protein
MITEPMLALFETLGYTTRGSSNRCPPNRMGCVRRACCVTVSPATVVIFPKGTGTEENVNPGLHRETGHTGEERAHRKSDEVNPLHVASLVPLRVVLTSGRPTVRPRSTPAAPCSSRSPTKAAASRRGQSASRWPLLNYFSLRTSSTSALISASVTLPL